MRQVPSPSAHAVLLDLAAAGGPRYVVLRVDEQAAREALVAHLVDIGAVSTRSEAEAFVTGAGLETVAVVW